MFVEEIEDGFVGANLVGLLGEAAPIVVEDDLLDQDSTFESEAMTRASLNFSEIPLLNSIKFKFPRYIFNIADFFRRGY